MEIESKFQVCKGDVLLTETMEKLAENSVDEDVPTRLIETAIALYGERGCHAVSAREIIRDAGVLNEAAIRYYFGNKEGFLEACMQSIADEFEPLMQLRWAELVRRKAVKSVTVRDAVTAMLGGLIQLQFQHSSAMKLLARMIREEGAMGQDLLLKIMRHSMWRFEQELAEILPQASPKALRLNTFLALNSIINGLVDTGLLKRLPATEIGGDFYKLEPAELMQGFIAYVSAGISSSGNL
jgi:AcrR family transcriptional regulator